MRFRGNKRLSLIDSRKRRVTWKRQSHYLCLRLCRSLALLARLKRQSRRSACRKRRKRKVRAGRNSSPKRAKTPRESGFRAFDNPNLRVLQSLRRRRRGLWFAYRFDRRSNRNSSNFSLDDQTGKRNAGCPNIHQSDSKAQSYYFANWRSWRLPSAPFCI